MFSDIEHEVNRRLMDLRGLLIHAKSTSPPPPAAEPNAIKCIKGLFFVHLYGTFEYAITNIVRRSFEEINTQSLNVCDFKPLFLSLILNSECDALFGATRKKWEKRWSLFRNLEDNPVAVIAESVLPTNGDNIKFAQLSSIWTTLCVDAPILNNVAMGGRLKDIVENRNAIAHGNESAAQVGSRFTHRELGTRFDEMSLYISYLFSTFTDYITRRDYVA